jgi:hypothetical protein
VTKRLNRCSRTKPASRYAGACAFISKDFGMMCRNDTEISTPAAKQTK